MPARVRRSGKTLYNYQHQQTRKRALAVFTEGTLCPFCHCRMYRAQPLDWDHTHRRIAHAHCNRSAGATENNRRRGRARTLPAWP